MTQPALFVANYIIEYSNEKGYPINNLRLQKILYFANARNIVETGKPLFKEAMEKWKYGPVIPTVYHEYKQYGAFEISKDKIAKDILRITPNETGGNWPIIDVVPYNRNNVANKGLIESTVDSLKDLKVFDLLEKTHDHDPWKKDESKIMSGEKSLEYTNTEIKEFFENNEDARLWI